MTEPTELFDYVNRPDHAFRWQQQSEIHRNTASIITLDLTSQRWQGSTWQHRVELFLPAEITHPGSVLLYVTAERNSMETELGLFLAQATGCVCAFLCNIPNQPLFDGLVEDALIAHTFIRYLDSDEPDWPLLLPMVKSVVKAMDTLKELAQQTGRFSADRFIVAGASKRGWTTWLTAVVDARVKAIIPLVYDNLNIPAQLPHQIEVSGQFSDRISDYTEQGLPDRIRTPDGQHLVRIVDPYTYRDRLTVPKLIINGSNDPYWMTDALNLYWDGLTGPKSILYIPNAGHSLTDAERLLGTVIAFVRSLATGRPLPQLAWNYTPTAAGIRLTISSDASVSEARCWIAHAPGCDFRAAHWNAIRMTAAHDPHASGWTAEIARSKTAITAVFGEIELIQDGHAFTLSTQITILPSLQGSG